MEIIKHQLKTPYAIIRYTNDQMYNNDESELYIIKDEKEYEEITNNIALEQPYTGGVYMVLFRKAKFIKKDK